MKSAVSSWSDVERAMQDVGAEVFVWPRKGKAKAIAIVSAVPVVLAQSDEAAAFMRRGIEGKDRTGVELWLAERCVWVPPGARPYLYEAFGVIAVDEPGGAVH